MHTHVESKVEGHEQYVQVAGLLPEEERSFGRRFRGKHGQEFVLWRERDCCYCDTIDLDY